MKKLIVICDNETTYARRLSQYLSHSNKIDGDIRVCLSAGMLIDLINSLDDSKCNGIIIIDRECTYELENSKIIEKMNGFSMTLLSKTVLPGCIFKYQSAELILEEILRENINEYANMSSEISSETDDLRDIKQAIKTSVQDKLLVLGERSDEETLRVIDECIERTNSNTDFDKRKLRNSVFYSIRGLDVLEELIADTSITEIMVNGENNIFYEKRGRIVDSGKSFDSKEQLLDIIQKIVSGSNRTVNMTNPIVDARLSDGSRVNVVLEPVSIDGPALTIRRFPETPMSAQTLIKLGAVTEEIMSFLRKLVFSGYNILVSGSTGSGKTTFMNILTGYIPSDERIITIEDSAELQIMGIANLVRLETRNANSEGQNEITIRDLIRTALRMRPDRVLVGEVRGTEAIDMLQAFSVGQDGSMSTIHANSAEDALYRLEMLMLLGKLDMPLSAIRRQISIGVDLIIQLGRLKDKSRKLLEIREVTGMEGDTVQTSLLFKYEKGEFIKYNDIKNTYKLEKAGCV